MQKLFSKGLLYLSAILLTTQAASAGTIGESISYDDPYSSYTDTQQSPGISFSPSQFGYEFFGPMSFQRGGGHAKLHNAFMFAQLISQKKDQPLTFGLDFFSRLSWLSTSGNTIFEGNQLYTFGLNGSCSYAITDNTRLFGGASVMLSTDMDAVSWDAFQLGVRGGISQRINDGLSIQLGLYYSPQLAQSPLLPIIGFRYTINDSWYTQLDPLRFKFINTVSETFSWGPFIGINGGSWNVDAHNATRRLSVFSCNTGLQGNFKLNKWGEYSPVLTVEAGCSIYNKMEYRNSNGRHEQAASRMDPGFYMQTAVKFEF